jgi:hypothetical protein
MNWIFPPISFIHPLHAPNYPNNDVRVIHLALSTTAVESHQLIGRPIKHNLWENGEETLLFIISSPH